MKLKYIIFVLIQFSLFISFFVWNDNRLNKLSKEYTKSEVKGIIDSIIDEPKALWIFILKSGIKVNTSCSSKKYRPINVKINDSLYKPKNKPYFLLYRKNNIDSYTLFDTLDYDYIRVDSTANPIAQICHPSSPPTSAFYGNCKIKKLNYC